MLGFWRWTNLSWCCRQAALGDCLRRIAAVRIWRRVQQGSGGTFGLRTPRGQTPVPIEPPERSCSVVPLIGPPTRECALRPKAPPLPCNNRRWRSAWWGATALGECGWFGVRAEGTFAGRWAGGRTGKPGLLRPIEGTGRVPRGVRSPNPGPAARLQTALGREVKPRSAMRRKRLLRPEIACAPAHCLSGNLRHDQSLPCCHHRLAAALPPI